MRNDHAPKISRRTMLSLAAGGLTWQASRHLLANTADAEDKNSDPAGKNVEMTGIGPPALAPFDDMMLELMREKQVVGSSLAAAKDGQLLYARGFGLANRESSEAVQPNALFRIASISKPVTAVAVLQLVEQKKLALDAKICPLLEIAETKDPRWREITVLELLQHTGGWDRDQSFDPMFRSVKIAKHFDRQPPAMPPEIIRYMTEQELDFDPGARYAYSNFGYSLLGRLIERTTGLKYGEYVRQKVLAPLGIHRMHLGKTLPDGRAKGEVHYYDLKNRTAPAVMGNIGEQVPLPYGAWCLEAMDAHGGWIASAVELVRFASCFNKPAHCELLSKESIDTMFACPAGAAGHDEDGKPKPSFYGCGWSVRPNGNRPTAWHTGALDGTSTLLVRRHDGLAWAVLFNCRYGTDEKELSRVVDPLLHKAAGKVEHWPKGDHFEKFL